MSKIDLEVQVRAVAAVSDGCAVFLGNEDKFGTRAPAARRRALVP